jgi:hypothetical protein
VDAAASATVACSIAVGPVGITPSDLCASAVVEGSAGGASVVVVVVSSRAGIGSGVPVTEGPGMKAGATEASGSTALAPEGFTGSPVS